MKSSVILTLSQTIAQSTATDSDLKTAASAVESLDDGPLRRALESAINACKAHIETAKTLYGRLDSTILQAPATDAQLTVLEQMAEAKKQMFERMRNVPLAV